MPRLAHRMSVSLQNDEYAYAYRLYATANVVYKY